MFSPLLRHWHLQAFVASLRKASAYSDLGADGPNGPKSSLKAVEAYQALFRFRGVSKNIQEIRLKPIGLVNIGLTPGETNHSCKVIEHRRPKTLF